MREKLIDICTPRQWKTLSTSELKNEGYIVYGANGVIGYYDEYNHEAVTVMVTCRGATCGTVNVSKPYSYINGNAMCMDDVRQDIDVKYLFYALKNYDFREVISGSAQPQITRQGLNKVYVKVVEKPRQLMIVKVLSNLEETITKKMKQLSEYDQLIKSRFIEMFGDPDTNPLGWDECALSKKINVIGGYTFKSDQFDENNGIPVLRIGNINTGYFKPVNMVYWKKDENLERYAIYPGDLVISLTGTVGKDDYGNVCILGNNYEMYYLNQRNAKLEIKVGIDKYYLYQLLKFEQVKKKLTGISRGVRQANISNKDILDLVVPVPPFEIQKQFAKLIQQVDKSRFAIQKSIDETQILFDSLMKEYFD